MHMSNHERDSAQSVNHFYLILKGKDSQGTVGVFGLNSTLHSYIYGVPDGDCILRLFFPPRCG